MVSLITSVRYTSFGPGGINLITHLFCADEYPFPLREKTTQVLLNVYDLSPSNDYLFPIGMGLHHTGVEIAGREYSYGSQGGIYDGRKYIIRGYSCYISEIRLTKPILFLVVDSDDNNSAKSGTWS